MVTFVTNQDVTTTTPGVEVTLDPKNPLPVGNHRFRLIVVDDSGNRSAATDVTISVKSNPVAQIRAMRDGVAVTQVPYGQAFNLDGSGSTDAGAKIVQYVWTYLGAKG